MTHCVRNEALWSMTLLVLDACQRKRNLVEYFGLIGIAIKLLCDVEVIQRLVNLHVLTSTELAARFWAHTFDALVLEATMNGDTSLSNFTEFKVFVPWLNV